MRFLSIVMFLIATSCGQPESYSELNSANGWLSNLITGCTIQNGLKTGCSIDEVTQLAPAQAVLSEFTIEYWYVNAGSDAGLLFSIGNQGGAPQQVSIPLTSRDYQLQTANPQTISITASRMNAVIGYGPVTTESANPSTLKYSHLSGNAALVIKSITVKPFFNASIIAQELKTLGAESTPWLALHAKTFAHHGGYINDRNVTMCNLQTTVQRFFDLFAVTDIESLRSEGGLTVKKFLEDATRSSAEAGAFTIGMTEPYEFLRTNWRDNLNLESAGKTACLADQTQSLSVPSETACGTNLACKVNVQDFNSSKQNLTRIRDRAAWLYAKAKEIQASLLQDDWFKTILSLGL